MPEPVADSGHYIRFLGWLREDGVFTLDRGWETPRITESPRGCSDYRLELLNIEHRVLESVLPEVETSDCHAVGGRMKTFRVLAYLPWHADGRALRFRKGDRVIDERSVAARPPVISNAAVRVTGDTLHVRWEATHDAPLVYKVAVVQGRRRATMVDRVDETNAAIPVESIPMEGECYAVILATDKLRSHTTRSAPFVLPPKSPCVAIVKPQDGDVFCEGTGISVVGHAIALDGRTLDDEALEWRVDGTTVAEGSRVAWVKALEIGAHRIELVWRGNRHAAAGIDVLVRGRTEDEHEWLNHLARFRQAASQSAVNRLDS